MIEANFRDTSGETKAQGPVDIVKRTFPIWFDAQNCTPKLMSLARVGYYQGIEERSDDEPLSITLDDSASRVLFIKDRAHVAGYQAMDAYYRDQRI